MGHQKKTLAKLNCFQILRHYWCSAHGGCAWLYNHRLCTNASSDGGNDWVGIHTALLLAVLNCNIYLVCEPIKCCKPRVGVGWNDKLEDGSYNGQIAIINQLIPEKHSKCCLNSAPLKLMEIL